MKNTLNIVKERHSKKKTMGVFFLFLLKQKSLNWKYTK